ncbi:MAG: hypothetical protein COV74_08635 [Candidatus Omnitrophica bacterium CG11_big_fil_rev_8_21_14_0_20_45_26]|uniref:Aminomethyltransferase folate-binding domain-containing protein n=1 Tax=Candidatus Abzuiibacterium crystallinum TaxID=1974748 RepID=A0A2H0LMC3_9BACT|nr:MAG: hypothetical protein COV74_08635 [Candidatus Omnitrophica bacterium CG11_big_fil_rev_8_21_14_0_20_45_26]PIW63727.1 MAG: hypothetical protein COW12_09520 [Candidatus Omnitrophica bacterium CG12_big_fil_rev_8_21_14_0_65_45_16]
MDKLLLEQYDNTAKHGAIFDVSARGKIELSGEDAVSFLHRMITNDIEHLGAGSGCYACFLTNQAKVIADMNVFVLEKTVWLDVEPGYRTKAIQALEKFVLMDNVKIEDKTEAFSSRLLFGPKAQVFLQMMTKTTGYPDQPFRHLCSKIKDMGCHIICLPVFGSRGWLLVFPKESSDSFHQMLAQAAASFDIQPMPGEIAEILRVENGVPRFGVDFDETTIVMEAGIEDRAISFDKGCYPGQELVARMDSRVKFAKKLTMLVLNDEQIPRANDPIQKEGKHIGRITSAVFSPKLMKPVALGFVMRDYLINGNEVEIISDGKPCRAKLKI